MGGPSRPARPLCALVKKKKCLRGRLHLERWLSFFAMWRRSVVVGRTAVRPRYRATWVAQRCSSSSSTSNKSPHDVWDDLFAGPSPHPTTETPTLGRPLPESEPMPRSIFHAKERTSTMRMPRMKKEAPASSSLTASESAQFRRIFELLEQEMGTSETSSTMPFEAHLGQFAERHSLAPEKITARGGGVGTRFEASREGLAAQLSTEELDRGVDQIWAALQSQTSAAEAWAWAEQHVWGTQKDTGSDEARPMYGTQTAFYAPALHMLLLTLRDRFHAPHTALAVLSHTHAMGPHSSVLGCTSSLYAEVIRTYWLCLQDAPGVLQTVREARSSGILAPMSSRRPVHGEDDAIREQIERVRTELRTQATDSAQARTALTLDAPATLTMYDDEQEQVQISAELRRIAGHTSRYTEAPAPTSSATPKHKKRRSRKSSVPRPPPPPSSSSSSLLIYPQNPQALLRTKVRRHAIEPEHA